jgi:hypothetical protein
MSGFSFPATEHFLANDIRVKKEVLRLAPATDAVAHFRTSVREIPGLYVSPFDPLMVMLLVFRS